MITLRGHSREELTLARRWGEGSEAGVQELEMEDGGLDERSECSPAEVANRRVSGAFIGTGGWKGQCGHMQGNAAGTWSSLGWPKQKRARDEQS